MSRNGFCLSGKLNTARMPCLCKMSSTVVKMCFQRVDALVIFPLTLKYDINILQSMVHNVIVGWQLLTWNCKRKSALKYSRTIFSSFVKN